MLSPSLSGPQPGVPQRLPEFIPSPGRPVNADGTRIGNIYVANTSSYPALGTRSMVFKRRPGSPASITNVRHDTCKIKKNDRYTNSRRNNETKYRILRLLQTEISPTNVKYPVNYLPTKETRPNMAGSEKKKEERLRGGHVTCSFAGVAVKDFKGPDKHNIHSRSTDLAKLNP